MVGSVINGAIDPTPIDLILPARGRARAEILARTLLREGYAASVVRQRAAAKGPGKDRAGGVAFQPHAGARRSHMLKHWTGSLRRGGIRLSPRTRGVIGGVEIIRVEVNSWATTAGDGAIHP